MEEEEWRDVPDYEGLYQVSSLGRVKSLERLVNNGKAYYKIKEKILKSSVDASGYPMVVLYNGGVGKTMRLHLLVSFAFLGHAHRGHKIDIDHINGIKTDPRVENLRIVTHRFNSTFGELKNKENFASKNPGVSWERNRNKWRSRIYIDGLPKQLGMFIDELDARDAYNAALIHANNGTINEYMDSIKRKCTSKYVGVYWSKQNKKWMSRITIKGKVKYLGGFTREIDASVAYQKALLEIVKIDKK